MTRTSQLLIALALFAALTGCATVPNFEQLCKQEAGIVVYETPVISSGERHPPETKFVTIDGKFGIAYGSGYTSYSKETEYNDGNLRRIEDKLHRNSDGKLMAVRTSFIMKGYPYLGFEPKVSSCFGPGFQSVIQRAQS